MKATLRLKRERLTELTAADLLHVAGAYAPTINGMTCPLKYCVIDPGFTDTSCNCCTASGSC